METLRQEQTDCALDRKEISSGIVGWNEREPQKYHLEIKRNFHIEKV